MSHETDVIVGCICDIIAKVRVFACLASCFCGTGSTVCLGSSFPFDYLRSCVNLSIGYTQTPSHLQTFDAAEV